MGSVGSRFRAFVTRPVREYNLQDRAHKAITSNKYVASPRHPSTDTLIKNTIESLPEEVKDNLENFNAELENRLREVYVTSQDIKPVQPPPLPSAERALPHNRTASQHSEYGFTLPKSVPYGKTTIKDALNFISHHQTDREQHSAQNIALKYKLDMRLTEEVLKHFGTFRLVVPAEINKKQLTMLKDMKASTTFLPNTPEVQRVLDTVAMQKKPGKTNTQIPMEQLKPPPVKYEATLMNPDPLPLLEEIESLRHVEGKESDDSQQTEMNKGEYSKQKVSVEENVVEQKGTESINSGSLSIRSPKGKLSKINENDKLEAKISKNGDAT